MCHNHVTKLGKLIGTDEEVDFKALVQAVKSACKWETHNPELMNEKWTNFIPLWNGVLKR